MGFPHTCNNGAGTTMELTKKGINASSVTREGYVVLIQVFLFLISLVMMVR
jgi:hypothetical protein